MTPYITEILAEVNKDPNLILTKFKDNQALKILLQYAFDKNLKMLLPEGSPPFKRDAAPIGMTPANFYQQVRKMYIFLRPDLTPVRREQLFIQLLESLHPSEADICVLVKDQNITSMFPGITADLVVKAGYVREENVFRPAVDTTKELEKTLVINLSDNATTKESFGSPPVETPAETQVEQPKKRRGRPPKKQ